MTESYGNILPKHAIYPSSGASPYLILLVVVKFLRAVGLFMSYDLLKLIPVVQFLFIVKAGSTIPLLLLQKPFSSGKRLSKNHWFRVIRHALFGGLINLLWLFGLTLCGPLRTILLFEHSDLVIVAGACAIFTNNGGGPSKMRGAIFFIIAVITLLLFDHDERLDNLAVHESSEIHQNIFTHLFYHVVNLIGWSDHKGGVVLLAITLFTHVGYSSASKKLSVDIGGSKRLHALSTLLQAILLFPWMVFMHFTRESYIESWLYLLFPLTLVILFVFVVDFYIEAVVTNHLQPPKTAVYGTYAITISALFLGLTWNHPMMAQITTLHKLRDIVTEDHVLSGGVVLSLMTFLLASSILGFPSKPSKGGSFVGYSPSGLPLYSFTGDALHKTTHSVLSIIKNGLRQILEDSNSRKIFYFLCINLIFTFVELVYGAWTNSLGLISDGFHMLFDCSALVMGLYAAIMSRWKATRIFSYGYDRVEILSGFINGLFLVVIGIFVFTEAIERLHEPPVVKTERLLTVSVIGLLVNLVGITAFRSSHTHGHGGHGHSHGGDQHGHSHGAPSQKDHNINMEGVFLHVLADTMGSVGVIISSLLIENFGWNIADPICSLFIATMILLSVMPLLKETSLILLLRMPVRMEKDLATACSKLLTVDGVLSYREPKIWCHTADKVFGSIHIQAAPDASEQKVVAQISSIFKEIGVANLTVQVEKESYFHHLSGLGANFNEVVQMTNNFKTQPLSLEDSFIKSI
ncbi:zinc transporter 5-like [Mizuhopecten yessoensis]|uniref:Proton-coupled zinc antiporter SLC30A5 n=1 Tax=Mizuhopecten yessoensis TaxID=6573 RepID=A0A210QZA4_MIZYE|nr:zinc transporter 5-like [Mizuhopecten yessoensis]OWF54084.1 Zinc transporter 5 [Mizuhopecten yessoensis]